MVRDVSRRGITNFELVIPPRRRAGTMIRITKFSCDDDRDDDVTVG